MTDTADAALGQGLLGVFSDFIDELRSGGVPVSTTEVLDAMAALRHLPIEDREALKLGLAAALVKQEGHWRTFETLFELYFSLQPNATGAMTGDGAETGIADEHSGRGLTAAELAELAYKALMEGDTELMAALARGAVDRYAGHRPRAPGRAVATTCSGPCANCRPTPSFSACWRLRARSAAWTASSQAEDYRRGWHGSAMRWRPRFTGASWPTGAPRRWPGHCAGRCPRTSTSCTWAATSWQPSSGPSSPWPANWPSTWPANAASAGTGGSISGPP